ncbi:DUF4307 domain-containing protein [Paenarthrobacter sp. Z7-10]|uniref:DUF4307 domain-containing protein n=1 Tax=Paenarthrobacter sp. Z7-10 TaxID=2787635 RepID=UPI0022A9B15E|nr:DUF4307 domain-containing protein [Paenarthrobacter sp. Z7-10]
MTVSDASAATSLTNRYGRPKRALTRRKKIILTAVIAVLVLAFVTWLAVGRGPAAVDSKVIGFSVTDATLTEVDFQVIKNPGSTAQCAVKALGSDFAVVGWDVLTIGPNAAGTGADQGRTTAHRAKARTESLAVSGVVDSCWLVSG